MTISVVTINLNNAAGLAHTIASVLEQQQVSIDYIVIDGASGDDSVKIIKKAGNRIHYWVSEPDHGVYHAQNKGLQVAKGSHILFLNSGDQFCDPLSLSRLALASDENTIVYGNLQVSDGKGGYWLKNYPHHLPPDYFNYETLPHPASLIPIAVLRNSGGFDESLRICSDWKFFREVFLGRKAAFAHVPVATSKFDATGMSSLEQNRELIETEKAMIKAGEQVPKNFTTRVINRLKKVWK